MNFDKYLFRASSLGRLMSEGKEKSNLDKYNDSVSSLEKLKAEYAEMPKTLKDGLTPAKSAIAKLEKIKEKDLEVRELEKIKDEIILSDGAKTFLMDVYIQETTGRKIDISNKYIEKGLGQEENSITLYSKIKKKFFKKNETHLKNLFIKGTPDVFEGNSIHECEVVTDIKSSWDVYTFYRTFTAKLNPIYFWQLIAYMWLTNAKKGTLAYCLVDTPEPLIQTELNRLWYKLGQPNWDSEIMVNAEKELIKSMTYGDIEINKKVLEYKIEWDDSYPEKIQKYVDAGRKYLNKIHLDITDYQKSI